MNRKLLKRTLQYFIYENGYLGFVHILAEGLFKTRETVLAVKFKKSIRGLDLPGTYAPNRELESVMDDYIRELGFKSILILVREIYQERLSAEYSVPFLMATNEFVR